MQEIWGLKRTMWLFTFDWYHAEISLVNSEENLSPTHSELFSMSSFWSQEAQSHQCYMIVFFVEHEANPYSAAN